MIIELDGKKLSTDGDDFWVAPNATVIGNVIMEKDSSIWFQCTISCLLYTSPSPRDS